MSPAAPVSTMGLVDAIARLLPDGFVALDPTRRVVAASQRARELLGPGVQPGAHFPGSGVDYRVLAVVQEAAGSIGVAERSLSIDGRELTVRVMAVEDESIGLLILIHDETQLRHLERVRKDFVSNVSHELRTPLTAVQLMAETLESGGLDDRDAAADFVHRIRLEAMHMAQIVEELLELSVVEYRSRPMAREHVDAADLLHTVDRLRPLAAAKQLTLTTTVEPQTPALLGDASRLGQVMRNLVHNAIKFTPHDGRIDVAARPGGRGRVVISVSDSGVGIAPADIPRIFERFWKADSSRRRDGEGSGLGLAIVRHVVEAHGGTIVVESEPKHGTTFSVDLPAQGAASDQPSAGMASE